MSGYRLQSCIRPVEGARVIEAPPDIMKDADTEPIKLSCLRGQGCFRLHRVSGRSATHEHDRINAACVEEGSICRVQGVLFIAAEGCFQLPLKSRSYFQVAHIMRASLLASATAALLWPTRFSVSSAQRRSRSSSRPLQAALLAASRAERAPWISCVRKYTSPCLLIRPRRRRSPEECSLAVIPSQHARWRPLGK